MARVLTVFGLLLSLLFSVGEGLRLSPFQDTDQPTPGLAVTTEQNPFVYGPLDVPVQVVKRTKRHSLDVDVPPVVATVQLPEVSLNCSQTQLCKPAQSMHSLRLGRAPPHSSYS